MNIWRRDWTKLKKPLSLFPSAKKGKMISKRCPIVTPRLVRTPVPVTRILKNHQTLTIRFLWLQLTAGHRTIPRNQTKRNKSILSGRRLESVYLRYQDWESAELGMYMSHNYLWTTHIFQWYFLLFDYDTKLFKCVTYWYERWMFSKYPENN